MAWSNCFPKNNHARPHPGDVYPPTQRRDGGPDFGPPGCPPSTVNLALPGRSAQDIRIVLAWSRQTPGRSRRLSVLLASALAHLAPTTFEARSYCSPTTSGTNKVSLGLQSPPQSRQVDFTTQSDLGPSIGNGVEYPSQRNMESPPTIAAPEYWWSNLPPVSNCRAKDLVRIPMAPRTPQRVVEGVSPSPELHATIA